MNLLEKCNGLHSGTKIQERFIGHGIYEEIHKNADQEIVVIHSWYTPSGEDSVDKDFEVIAVYPSLIEYDLGRIK